MLTVGCMCHETRLPGSLVVIPCWLIKSIPSVSVTCCYCLHLVWVQTTLDAYVIRPSLIYSTIPIRNPFIIWIARQQVASDNIGIKRSAAQWASTWNHVSLTLLSLQPHRCIRVEPVRDLSYPIYWLLRAGGVVSILILRSVTLPPRHIAMHPHPITPPE